MSRTHGSIGTYVAGCRCDQCREANTTQRRINLGLPPVDPYKLPSLARIVTSESWMQSAECRGMDTRLFYPEQGEDVSQARAVCAICPVSRQCGDYATRNHERYGLWGGSSGRQRRQNLHVDLTVVDTLRRHAGRETEVA